MKTKQLSTPTPPTKKRKSLFGESNNTNIEKNLVNTTSNKMASQNNSTAPPSKSSSSKSNKKTKIDNASRKASLKPTDFHSFPVRLCDDDEEVNTHIPTDSSTKDSSIRVRFMYYRAYTHGSKNDEDEMNGDQQKKSIHVVNIPIDWNDNTLQNAFAIFGPCTATILPSDHHSFADSLTIASHWYAIQSTDPFVMNAFSNHRLYRSAIVEYEDVNDCIRALKTDLSDVVQPWRSQPLKMGVENWISDYDGSLPEPSSLQQKVDKIMEAFDTRTAEERNRRSQTKVDEDGFQIVTHKRVRRVGDIPETEIIRKNWEAKQAKKATGVNFYSFQDKETKQKRIETLQKQFAADKEKIAAMKAKRKFNPL